MAKSYNQKAKILILQQMLLGTDEEHKIGMQEIIDKLASYGIRAERKSIYDDVAALKDFGYDIRLQRGRAGGYYLKDAPAEITGASQKLQAAEAPAENEGTEAGEEKAEQNTRVVTQVEYRWCVSEKEIKKDDSKNVRLLCAKEREQDVRSYFGEYGEYKEKEPGMITVTLPAVSGPEFFGWLTAMGTDVHLVKPRKTVTAYRDYLKTLVKEYK